MLELIGSAVAGGASELEKRFLWEGSKRLAHGGWGERGKVGGVGGAGRSLGRSSSGQLLGIGVMAGPGGEWQCGAEATFLSKSRLPPPNSECLEKDHHCFRPTRGCPDPPAPFCPRLQLDVARLRVEARLGLGLAGGTRGFSGHVCPSLRCRGVMLSLLGRCPWGPDWGGLAGPIVLSGSDLGARLSEGSEGR